MALRRILAFLLLAVLVADGMAFIPGARAFTTVNFNTTSLFDSGTKTNVSTQTNPCENVTANGLALNNSGAYQGVGLTTGTATCATGAWGVNASGLALSYDMQTLNAGKMKDFSGNGNGGTINSVTPIGGKYGNAYSFPGLATHYVQTANLPMSVIDNLTMAAWVYPSALPQGGGIVYNGRNNNPFTGYGFAIGNCAGGNGSKLCGAIAVAGFQDSGYTFPAPNTWYPVIMERVNGILKWWVNGTQTVLTKTPAIVSPVTYALIGSVTPTTFPMMGRIDEVAMAPRVWSAAEISSFSTDGRSSFLSSGSWQSPTQNAPLPIDAQFTLSGQTANNRISRFQVLSSSGAVLFDRTLPYFGGSPFDIPINVSAFPPLWSVKLFMIGNGTASASLTSLVLTVGFAPTFDTNAMIFIVFIVFILLFLVIGLWQEIPLLVFGSGVIGVLFGLWFLTATASATLAVVIMVLSAFLMIWAGAMAFSGGGD